ncbi:hypothetical protein [Membranihabitans maritimus]|uniref:hypothetical protein n=1 Tax=Membranihabitans maritimus TaxID=2904244 RepID=UPI001F249184|nr:hypothetical protein [Membranihabitans maritimus]
MSKISKLTCEATQLRKARFALADSIRHFQDSMLHMAEAKPSRAKHWESELQTMLDRKTMLTSESRDLADTIRNELLILTNNMTVDEKRLFNDSLQSRTEKMGCSQ